MDDLIHGRCICYVSNLRMHNLCQAYVHSRNEAFLCSVCTWFWNVTILHPEFLNYIRNVVRERVGINDELRYSYDFSIDHNSSLIPTLSRITLQILLRILLRISLETFLGESEFELFWAHWFGKVVRRPENISQNNMTINKKNSHTANI